MELVRELKRFVSPAPSMSQDDLRRAKPEQNPVVESHPQEDGSIILVAPLEQQGRGALAWIAKKMQMPSTKSFELEPVGAFVWANCDGKQTFETISRKLRDRYKMNRLEADAALTSFLQTLGQRRLISLKMGKPK